MKILFVILVIILSACSSDQLDEKVESPKNSIEVSNAQAPLDEKELSMLKKYTLEQFGMALNVLRVTLDQSKKTNPEFCQLKTIQASQYSQQLKFLIDEKVAQTKIPKNPPTLWRECEQTCTCGIYANVYKDENDYFNQKASSLSNQEAYACAKKVTWFCSSELFNYLKENSN